MSMNSEKLNLSTRDAIDALNESAWNLRFIDTPRAAALAENARSLSQQRPSGSYKAGLAKSLKVLATICERRAQYAEGLSMAYESLQLFSDLGDENEQAFLLMTPIALSYLHTNNHEEALISAREGMAIWQQHNKPETLAAAHNNLGYVYMKVGMLNEALVALRNSVTLAQEYELDKTHADALNNLSHLALLQNDYKEALSFSQAAAALYRSINYPFGEAEAYQYRAEALLAAKQFEAALSAFEKAIDLANESQNAFASIAARIGQGSIQMEIGHIEEAHTNLSAALTLAELITDSQQIATCHEKLADLFRSQGDFEQALHHYERFHLQREYIINDRILQQVNVLKIGHRVAAYERETAHYSSMAEIMAKSETMLANILESAADAIILIDHNQNIIRFNRWAALIFGYEPGEIIGKSLDVLIPHTSRHKHRALVDNFRHENVSARNMLQRQNVNALRKDGSTFPAMVSISYMVSGNGKPTYTAILRDVTDRVRFEEAIMEQNAELDAFAHTVAHDLKGPLHHLLGFSSMLREPDMMDDPELLNNYLHYIQNAALKANNIINELLLLATVRKEDVHLSNLDLAAVAQNSYDRLYPQIEESQATITLPEEWPPALGHAPWVEEILVNYLSNAIKYGGEPPEIRIAAQRLPNGYTRIEIHDNGEGLNPKQQEALFAEFTRLDRIRAQGHGLGLSIVRRIADKLSGRVGVESEVGVGSCFYVDLPTP